jgi:hypothetical protein
LERYFVWIEDVIAIQVGNEFAVRNLSPSLASNSRPTVTLFYARY